MLIKFRVVLWGVFMFSVSMYVFFVIKDECFFDFRLEIKIVEKWCCYYKSCNFKCFKIKNKLRL